MLLCGREVVVVLSGKEELHYARVLSGRVCYCGRGVKSGFVV